MVNTSIIKSYIGIKSSNHITYDKISVHDDMVFISATAGKLKIVIRIINEIHYFYLPMANLEIPMMRNGKNLSKRNRKFIRKLIFSASIKTRKELVIDLYSFIVFSLEKINRENPSLIDFMFRVKLFNSLDVISRVMDGYHLKNYKELQWEKLM